LLFNKQGISGEGAQECVLSGGSEAARTAPLFLGKHQVQLDDGEDDSKAFRHINLNAYLHFNGAFHWYTQGNARTGTGV